MHLLSERSTLPQRDAVAAAEHFVHELPEPPHAHEFMEIVVVMSGTAVHRMRSGSRRVRAGSVLLIRPGQWHAYDEPQDFQIWNLFIPTKTLGGELAALRGHPVLAAFTSAKVRTARVRTAGERGSGARGDSQASIGRGTTPSPVNLSNVELYLKELAQPSRTSQRSLTRLGQLLVVLDLLAPALAFVKPGQALPETHPAVIAATELLDVAPEYPWTLADLAERVHISASYLCRLFTRELGISPLHYLERHRLELTAQLLLEGDLSIRQISASAGWSDTNYMTRRFHAAHGMPPTRYRAVFQERSRNRQGRLS